MDALDLTLAPPRSPRHLLGGLVMLARTIDKVRATLPGGDIGVYKVEGMSGRFFDGLNLDPDEFSRRVASAEDEDDVVRWIVARTARELRDAYNEGAAAQTIGQRIDDPSFLERYPAAKRLTSATTLFDLLDEDDREMFSVRR